MDALDGFADVLEGGVADAVLAAEEDLAAAVSDIRSADLVLISRDPQTRWRLEAARHKLARCRALGAAASGLMALAGPAAYARPGLRPN